MSKIYKNTYFSHDHYAREDQKIKNMLTHFRKESEDKAKAAVCVFWWIIEDMHKEDYFADRLETYADNYRCSVEFLKSILNDFDLFHIEDNCYVSERVKKNLKEQKERKIKAQKAAYFRWKKEYPPKEEEPEEVDNEVVDKIINLFKEEFNKEEQIVSVENREKIYKITRKNALTLEHWKKIFHTAKRGWNIDGKNKKPSFEIILNKWDNFANDDYYLAPDTSGIEQAKKKEAEEAERRRRQEQESKQAYLAEKEAVNNAKSAIAFLNKYFCLPKNALTSSKIVKELSAKYGFTIKELLQAR